MLLNNPIFFVFPKILELFFTPKKTPPKVKNSKPDKRDIFLDTLYISIIFQFFTKNAYAYEVIVLLFAPYLSHRTFQSQSQRYSYSISCSQVPISQLSVVSTFFRPSVMQDCFLIRQLFTTILPHWLPDNNETIIG